MAGNSISHVMKGDPPSARHQNRLIDRVNDLSREHKVNTFALFETQEEFDFPGRAGISGTTTMPPYCNAKRVHYSFENEDLSSDYESLTEVIYYPQAVRDEDTNEYKDENPFDEKSWLWCVWNLETGRWEIVSSNATLPPGEHKNDILRWNEENKKWELCQGPSDTVKCVLACIEGVMQWIDGEEFYCEDSASSGQE